MIYLFYIYFKIFSLKMSNKIIFFISIFLLFHLSNSILEEDQIQLEISIVCKKDPSFIFGKEESAFTFETDLTDDSNIFDPNKIEEDTKFQTTYPYIKKMKIIIIMFLVDYGKQIIT